MSLLGPVALIGAGGRMGRAISAVLADEGVADVAAFGRSNLHELAAWLRSTRATVIDFSAPSAVDAVAAAVSAASSPWLCGTTGLDATARQLIAGAAQLAPVMHAPNTSLGIAVLRRLTALAAAALPPSFDVEILEAHHRAKRDAPSGTALSLAEAVVEGRPASELRGDPRWGLGQGRHGREVGLAVVRGGDVVGEHTVFFLGDGERIELSHRATDRRIFARGAVEAARWLSHQPHGSYTLDDMLGLGALSVPSRPVGASS